MTDDRPRRLPLRLGASGAYVLTAWAGTLLWFPARWYDVPNAPLAVTAVRAGLWGTVWPLGIWLVVAASRRTAPEDTSWARACRTVRRGEASADKPTRTALAEHLPRIRRSALIGLLAGVPLFVGLAALAVHIGWYLTAVLFTLLLAGVVAVAVRTLTRVRRLQRDLAEPAPPTNATDPTGA